MTHKTQAKEYSWEWKGWTTWWFVASIVFLLCFGLLSFARFHVDHPITGDEPHYLLMDYSMLHDHDLNLANNYLNHDSDGFYPGLSSSEQVGNKQLKSTTRQYSIHGIGLPLLLLPGYALGGPRGTEIEMVFFATVTVFLTWYWAKIVTKSVRAAWGAAAVLLISYVYVGLAGYIYPDIIIAGFTLAALILMQQYYRSVYAQCGIAILAGFMLLIHFKTLAVVLPLMGALIYKTWRYERKAPWAAGVVFLLFMASFFLMAHQWFGNWNPSNVYVNVTLRSSVIHNVSAMLFDSMRGLLVNCPAMLLLFVGAPVWIRRSRETAIITGFCVLPSLAILASFSGWQGGDSNVGRYFIDTLPVLMPAVAFAIGSAKATWQRVIVWLLGLSTLALTVDFIYLKRPYVRASTHSPIFLQLKDHLGIAFDKLLPTFSDQTTVLGNHDWIKIAIGYAIIGGLLVYGWRLGGAAAEPAVKPTHG